MAESLAFNTTCTGIDFAMNGIGPVGVAQLVEASAPPLFFFLSWESASAPQNAQSPPRGTGKGAPQHDSLV